MCTLITCGHRQKNATPCEDAAVCYFSGIIVCKNASEVQVLGRGCITLIASAAYSMDTQRIVDKAKDDFIGFMIKII